MLIFNSRPTSRYIANVSSLLAARKDEIISPALHSTLKDLQREWDTQFNRLESCNLDAASKELKRLRSAYAADPSKKNHDALKDRELDIDALQDNHRQQRRAIREGLKNFYLDKVVPAFAGLHVKVIEIVQAELDRIQQIEKAHATALGIPFEPSETLGALESRIERTKESFQSLGASVSYKGPRDVLRSLELPAGDF